MRPSASRNQRNKGFRAKNALQLFLLASVCVWLLYQLKHSYDKKRLIEESSAKISNRVAENEFDFLRLGRKDLPHAEDTGYAKTNAKEDENEETEVEEEQETKREAASEHVRGNGDDETDEIDEQDQEKVDDQEEGDHGEESADEGEGDTQGEDMDLLDEEEHDGGSQEAREEHYKRDDASSAVRHDTQSTESEFANRDTRNRDEEEVDVMAKTGAEGENGDNMEREDLERVNGANERVDTSKGNNDTGSENLNGFDDIISSIVQRENETLHNGSLSANETSSVKMKETEDGLSILDIESISNSTPLVQDIQNKVQTNSTASIQSNNQTELQANSTTPPSANEIETQNNSTQLDGVTTVVPLKNETVSIVSFDERNATVNIETPREVKPNLAAAELQQIEKSGASENGSGTQRESDTTRENGVAAHSEIDAKRSENGDASQGESDNSLLNTAEEKEAATVLSIFSDIKNGAKSNEDEAAE